MKEKILLALLIIVAGGPELLPNARAQDVGNKAQQVLDRARAAIGGEKLRALTSLSVTGTYRRMLAEREMSGEVQFELLLPDKMLRTETLSPAPSVELTRIEAINGDRVWIDQQSSGLGGGMVIIRRPGGDTPHGQARQDHLIRAEFARITLGWLLSTYSSLPVELSYAGEAEAPDGMAEAVDVKGPNGFLARLFVDQKTHKPLMLTYKGKKPRVVTRTVSGPERSKEEIEKGIKDAEMEAAKEPEVEFQIRYSDYRETGGISFPHRLTRSINGEVNEEWEMTRFKINPSLKPEKFEKK
jgi:hypothetical protein